MGQIKDKLLAKVDNKSNKKSIENLVVFVIILIATIIFINYIWNGDKNNKQPKSNSAVLSEAEEIVINDVTSDENNTLEKQIEDILKSLKGVDDVKVLITYSETNKVVPMYNEDNQQSVTQEEDTQGRS